MDMLTITSVSPTFRRVKYTKAGKEFMQNQPNNVKEAFAVAEYCMLENKYTNLVINKKGYAVQYKGENGKHCYKIKKASYNWKKDILEYSLDSKAQDKMSFNLKHDKETAKRMSNHVRMMKYDTTGVMALRLNLDLIELLENQAKKLYEKPNLFQRIFHKLK